MTEMKGIKEIEQIILIETAEMAYPVNNLYNDVKSFNSEAAHEDICRYMCSIIGSMLTEGKITLKKSFYEPDKDYPDSFSLVSSRDLTDAEADLVLKHPENWDQNDFFSQNEIVELDITNIGREILENS